MNTDTAHAVAFAEAAPQPERTAALAELHQVYRPNEALTPATLAQIIEVAATADPMMKAMKHNVVPFPGPQQGKPGMQSVTTDDWLMNAQGDYIEKPGGMTFPALRSIVDQTPVLAAVIMTRLRQVMRFCRVQESGEGLGFTVRHSDRDHQLQESERETINKLNRFFLNCGWEFNPRERKKLRRESFPQFVQKLVRDTLTLDAAAIETEFKRDRSKGIDGLYAVDGATIRLCMDDGYQGDRDVFALQVVSGRIRTAYSHDDLIYEPRNPRADVLVGGYGLSEAELLIRVVTGFLNAMTVNIRGFSENHIPRGVLHLTGNYSPEDLSAFRRYWNSMVKGVQGAWTLPILVSRDQESKASFENFGIEYNEMYFSKWMTFLTSIICSVYGMSPSEISFDSFTAGNTSSLSGSDTEEKLADSKDKGLRPLLAYFEGLFTDYIVQDFSDDFCFRWTGLDEEDLDVRDQRARLVLTVNEMRAEEGYEAMEGPLGEAPLNPSLVGPWLQMQQAAQQPPPDFGQEEPGADQEPPPDFGQAPGPDFSGQQPDNQGGPDFGQDPGPDFGQMRKAWPQDPTCYIYRLGADA